MLFNYFDLSWCLLLFNNVDCVQWSFVLFWVCGLGLFGCWVFAISAYVWFWLLFRVLYTVAVVLIVKVLLDLCVCFDLGCLLFDSF